VVPEARYARCRCVRPGAKVELGGTPKPLGLGILNVAVVAWADRHTVWRAISVATQAQMRCCQVLKRARTMAVKPAAIGGRPHAGSETVICIEPGRRRTATQ